MPRRLRVGHRDTPRQRSGEPVRQARNRRLLVDQRRNATERSADDDGECDEAARAEHRTRRQSSERTPRASDAGGNVDGEITRVAPVEVAPQLARPDSDVLDAGGGDASCLDAVPAADPSASMTTCTQHGRDGKPRGGVAAGAPSCDDERHLP